MVMAGIYDSTDGCAIITAPSQGVVATLHDRMPVVLAAGQVRGLARPERKGCPPDPCEGDGGRPDLLPGEPSP